MRRAFFDQKSHGLKSEALLLNEETCGVTLVTDVTQGGHERAERGPGKTQATKAKATKARHQGKTWE